MNAVAILLGRENPDAVLSPPTPRSDRRVPSTTPVAGGRVLAPGDLDVWLLATSTKAATKGNPDGYFQTAIKQGWRA
jgi:hypothetical protein